MQKFVHVVLDQVIVIQLAMNMHGIMIYYSLDKLTFFLVETQAKLKDKY